jgi:hypothetical protein
MAAMVRRRVTRALGLFSVAMVATILLLELTLRIAPLISSDSACYVRDAQVGFRPRPHVRCGDFITNSLGFHDVEHRVAKRPAVVRLAFIGDSFVVGAVPREANLASVTQDLGNRSGLSVEVINMGIPAAGPGNYLGLLEHDAVALGIDVACLVFFVGNDITQAHPDFETSVWLGATRETLRAPYLVGPSLEYSYAYRTARSLTRSLRERFSAETEGTFSPATYLSIEKQRLSIYEREPSAFIRESYQGARMLLGEMARSATRHGIRLAIALAPDEVQVNPDLRRAVADAYSLQLDRYDFDAPQRVLSGTLRDLSLPTIDLLPLLRNQDAAVYLPRDTHWNAQGNRLVAEAVWDALGRADLIGPDVR